MKAPRIRRRAPGAFLLGALLLSPGDEDARLGTLVTLDSYHPWTPSGDLDAWRERSEYVRRQILVAAGLWPEPPRTSLEPVIHGRIDRDGYTVEKVFFQSVPGLYVTGNLYRPKTDGPHPGVLCPHGHWTNGRFSEIAEGDVRGQIDRGEEAFVPNGRYHLQSRCAELARRGCVVFHYDMLEYADSWQVPHRSGFGDVEAELWSQSWFGVQTWNSIRSLDFLLSLPDVDPDRIGVTGGSGGGTQTFILAAVDPRPDVAFPAVMVSTAMQGGCKCENASHLRVGTGNIELAALTAPRPLGMTGANDWTIEIETKGLPQLRELYGLFGEPALVEARCRAEFAHNYNLVSRRQMYAWFDRHLALGHGGDSVEAELVPIAPRDLSVFDADHPRPADAVDVPGLKRWLRARAEDQIEARVPNDAGSLDRFRAEVGGALEVLMHTALPPEGGIESIGTGDTGIDGCLIRELHLRRRGTAERVPARLAVPSGWTGAVVVAVSGTGRDAFVRADGRRTYAADRLLDEGAAVLAVDVFLVGDARVEGVENVPVDPGRHRDFVGYTYGYNKTLIAQRVHDVLTGIAYARDLEGATSVRLIGLGDAGPWALLARALAGDSVARTLADWSEPFRGMRALDDPDFLPGALRHGGMRAFAGLSAPGELRLTGGAPVPSTVRAAYAAAGASDAVGAAEGGSGAELLSWLIR